MIGVCALISVGLFSIAMANSNCHRHAYYSDCGNSCAPTCRNPHPNNVCNLECTSGCFCRRGYYLEDDGSCVRHGRCHSSADRSGRKHRHRSRGDKSRKRKRGDCDDNNKNCKSSSSEQDKCGPNEEYRKCKSSCGETCDSKKPRSCDNKCKHRGCVCKDGFVKDKEDNCIPKGLCPNKKGECAKNERYLNESTCVQPSACQTPNCLALPLFCPVETCTNGGCVCKSGFLRKKGKCVLPDNCLSDSKDDKDKDDRDDDDKHKDKKKNNNKSNRKNRDRSSCEDDCDSIECEKHECRKHRGRSCEDDCDSAGCETHECRKHRGRSCEDDCESSGCETHECRKYRGRHHRGRKNDDRKRDRTRERHHRRYSDCAKNNVSWEECFYGGF